MSRADDRLAEIANICAGHVATALASLLDATLLMEPPLVHALPAGRSLDALLAPEDRVAAVFIDLEGVLRAQAAIALSASAIDEVLARVAGKRAEETSEVSTLTVLAEVGNIAVSAAANALAELLGGRSLPSVPRAGYAREGVLSLRELDPASNRRRTVLIVELIERGGPLRLHFVLAPVDPPIV
ncbi:MAG: chemotaxis protein CheC [Myxococcota bacterium]